VTIRVPLTIPLGGALWLAAALAPAAAAQEPEGARIASVRFEGVNALDRRLLREAIETRPSRCRSVLLLPVCVVADARWAEITTVLDPQQVATDRERIRSLYADWGYPAAAVRSRTQPRRGAGVDVVFEVSEGEPVRVRSLALRGMEALHGIGRVPSPLPLRVGEPFSQARLEATERVLRAVLAEAGYAFARIEVEPVAPAAPGPVDVVLSVTPGPVAVFGPTVVQAGPPLRVRDVERRLAYRPGERFRPSALEHTSERLRRLPIVSRVFVDPLPAAGADSVMVTTLGVVARRTTALQGGGAFSTASCLEGNVGWGHRYLFRAPRTFSLSGGAANLLARPLRRFPCTGIGDGEFSELDYSLRADLMEPVGADTWLLLGGLVSRETAQQAYIRRGVQAQIGIGHAFGRDLEATVIYTPERRDLLTAGPLFCGLHGVCDAAAIDALASGATLAPLEVGLVWRPPLARRPPAPPLPGPAWMDPFLPEWLFTVRATAAGAGGPTGSEFQFGRVSLETVAVRGRGRRAELGTRLRLGALIGADEPLPPHARLFGGGPLGVRGVQVNRLGPRILAATPQQVEALGCDAVPGGCQGVEVDPRLVRARPTGGEQLVELSVEGRLWVAPWLQLAAFADWGTVRSGATAGSPAAVAPSEALWSPGVGALALTGFGPLRLDVALNTEGARSYPLLMRTDPQGDQLHLGDVVYDRFRFDEPARLRELWRRLQFQFSMGSPF
jgi:outer membrane protein assembly factor BamA